MVRLHRESAAGGVLAMHHPVRRGRSSLTGFAILSWLGSCSLNLHSKLRSMLGLAVDNAHLAVQSFLFLGTLQSAAAGAAIPLLTDATSACVHAIHSGGEGGHCQAGCPACLAGSCACSQSLPAFKRQSILSSNRCSLGYLCAGSPSHVCMQIIQLCAACCCRCSRRWLLCLQLI